MKHTENKLPFMVSVLLAIGAWLACLAALFLIGLQNLLWTGAAFVVAAAVLVYAAGRKSGLAGVFMEQVSLAFSLSGKGLLIWSMVFLWNLTPGQTCLLVWAVTAAGYCVFTQKMDRAVMVFASMLALQYWLFGYQTEIWPYMETLSIVLFVLAYVLFFVPAEQVRPLAWGILPSCAVAFLFGLFGVAPFGLALNTLLLGACLCGVYAWRMKEKFNIGIAVLIILLCYLSNAGTVMGVALLALAFGQNRLSLKIAGYAVFALSLIWLYYHMQTTLLVKAYYLWAAGLVLLGLYAWQKRGHYAR